MHKKYCYLQLCVLVFAKHFLWNCIAWEKYTKAKTVLKKGDDCDIPVAPEIDILKLPLYVIEDTYSTELGLL